MKKLTNLLVLALIGGFIVGCGSDSSDDTEDAVTKENKQTFSIDTAFNATLSETPVHTLVKAAYTPSSDVNSFLNAIYGIAFIGEFANSFGYFDGSGDDDILTRIYIDDDGVYFSVETNGNIDEGVLYKKFVSAKTPQTSLYISKDYGLEVGEAAFENYALTLKNHNGFSDDESKGINCVSKNTDNNITYQWCYNLPLGDWIIYKR